MKPYKTCPHCGANLDPGERCDCTDHSSKGNKAFIALSAKVKKGA